MKSNFIQYSEWFCERKFYGMEFSSCSTMLVFINSGFWRTLFQIFAFRRLNLYSLTKTHSFLSSSRESGLTEVLFLSPSSPGFCRLDPTGVYLASALPVQPRPRGLKLSAPAPTTAEGILNPEKWSVKRFLLTEV